MMIQIKEFKSHATDESLTIRVNRFLKELDVKGQRVVELKYANMGSSEGCSVLVVYECEEEIICEPLGVETPSFYFSTKNDTIIISSSRLDLLLVNRSI